MARITMGDIDSYVKMLQELDYSADEVFKTMVSAGIKIVLPKMRDELPTFRKHIKPKSPKKNEWGWFGQIQFKGTTRTGAPAALAAMAYNYGRRVRNSEKTVTGKNIIDNAESSVRSKVEEEMQRIYEEKLKELNG